MKLYYAPGACSLSPHIVASEAGIEIQLEKVDLKAKKTESGEDFNKVNPKGYVPALRLDDGAVLTEGPAIVQYLADRNPGSGLAPNASSVERYKLDAYLFTLLNWGQWTKVDLSRWPALAQYAERVKARPKVQEALKAEGLVT